MSEYLHILPLFLTYDQWNLLRRRPTNEAGPHKGLLRMNGSARREALPLREDPPPHPVCRIPAGRNVGQEDK